MLWVSCAFPLFFILTLSISEKNWGDLTNWKMNVCFLVDEQRERKEQERKEAVYYGPELPEKFAAPAVVAPVVAAPAVVTREEEKRKIETSSSLSSLGECLWWHF